MSYNLFFTNPTGSATVSDAGVKVTGMTGGLQTVKLTAAATGVTIDPNVERVEFSGASAAYTYKAVAGVGVQVFSGATQVATIPSLNQNVTFAFTDGSLVLAQTGGNTFALNGTAVPPLLAAATAVAVAPTTAILTGAGNVSTVPTGVVAPTGPTITVSAGTLTESVNAVQQPAANMTFTVTLSAAQATNTTVNFATSNTLSPSAAAAGSDYTSTNGVVTILAGQTTATFTVPILDDTLFDGTLANPTGVETFTVTLSNPSVGTLVNTTTTGTITDGEFNTAPTNTVPSTTALNMLLGGTLTNPAGISVADINGNTLSTQITANGGLLSAPAGGALATSVNAQTSITLTGSAANINATLAQLSYTSSRVTTGVDTLTVVTNDGFVSTAPATVTINVGTGGVFTTGTDTFVGTSGTDIYTANSGGGAIFSNLDSLNAGAGTDTLTVTNSTGSIPNIPAMLGLEILNLSTDTGSSRTVDVAITGAGARFDTNLTTINFTDPDPVGVLSDTLRLTGMNPGTTINLSKSLVAAANTANWTMSGIGQTLNLALAGGVVIPELSAAFNATFAAGTLNIASNGTTANAVTIIAASSGVADGGTVNITGAAPFTLTETTGVAAQTYNASAATGAFTMTFGAVTGTVLPIVSGGSANDTLTGTATALALTMSGNAGNDTIAGGSGSDTLSGGDGNDSISGGTADDSITGGDGNDTITGGTGGDAINGGAGNDQLNLAALDTVVAGGFAVSATTAAFSASKTTVGADIVTGFAAGDTVQLAAATYGTTLLTGATATLGVATAGDVILLRGTYTAAGNTFVGSLTGADSMLVYDTNGTTAAGTYEGIVLVGYVDAGAADTISSTGLFAAVA